MNKYNAFTLVFNPRRGMVEVLLQTIYADSISEARREKGVWEKGEKRIVRPA